MGAPTKEEILVAIDQVIDGNVKEGEHALYDWEALIEAAWRRAGTTSPAARSRMEVLAQEGDLRFVKVAHDGYAHLELGVETFMWSAYLVGQHPPRYGERLSWGVLTDERVYGRPNLWANGVRRFWTTSTRYEAMIAHFRGVCAAYAEKRLEESAREKEAFWTLAEEKVPDIRDLFKRLEDMLPGVGVSRMVRSQRPVVMINTTAIADLVRLAAILRRGLPDEND